MAGLSDKAIKPSYADNKLKFNEGSELQNREFSDGSGLEDYDFNARWYDPQIGKFFQLDPLSEAAVGWSPFVYANDNPILFNDPLGMAGDSSQPKLPGVDVPPLPEVVVTADMPDKSDHTIDIGADVGPPPEKAQVQLNSSNSSNSSGSTSSTNSNTLPLIISLGTGSIELGGAIATGGLLIGGAYVYAALARPANYNGPPSNVPNSDLSSYVPKPNIDNGLIKKFASAAAALATGKTLNDLVPGRLKRQKKWDDGYANKTPEEIEELAKKGDAVARTMKKIYENAKRLMDKQSGKPK